MHAYILCLSDESDGRYCDYESVSPEIIGAEYIDENYPRAIPTTINGFFGNNCKYTEKRDKDENGYVLSYGYLKITDEQYQALKNELSVKILGYADSLCNAPTEEKQKDALLDLEGIFSIGHSFDLIYYCGMITTYADFVFNHLSYVIDKKIYITGCVDYKC